jgi:hypothetical protein
MMRKQLPNDPAHEPDMKRERRWDVARITPYSRAIIARYMAVVESGEDLTEFPPTYEFESWDDFSINAPSLGIEPDDWKEALGYGSRAV